MLERGLLERQQQQAARARSMVVSLAGTAAAARQAVMLAGPARGPVARVNAAAKGESGALTAFSCCHLSPDKVDLLGGASTSAAGC